MEKTIKCENGFDEFLYENNDYILVEEQPLDDMRHGWLKYRLVLRENVTGRFFVTYARLNDEEGWDDETEIHLTEVFPKQKTITVYE